MGVLVRTGPRGQVVDADRALPKGNAAADQEQGHEAAGGSERILNIAFVGGGPRARHGLWGSDRLPHGGASLCLLVVLRALRA